jgi:hypothetical protein
LHMLDGKRTFKLGVDRLGWSGADFVLIRCRQYALGVSVVSKREYARRQQSRRAKQGALSMPTVDPRGEPDCFFSEDGHLVLRNPELFRPGHERLCGRVILELVKRDGIRSARASLTAGTCELEFLGGHGGDHAEVANRVASALHAAIAPEPLTSAVNGVSETWSVLSAFCIDDAVSLWQTIREQSGHLRLRNRLLRSDGTLAKRVARAVADLPGVQNCRATIWAHDLEIGFDPALTDSGSLTRAVAVGQP